MGVRRLITSEELGRCLLWDFSQQQGGPNWTVNIQDPVEVNVSLLSVFSVGCPSPHQRAFPALLGILLQEGVDGKG